MQAGLELIIILALMWSNEVIAAFCMRLDFFMSKLSYIGFGLCFFFLYYISSLHPCKYPKKNFLGPCIVPCVHTLAWIIDASFLWVWYSYKQV
jgi:hypothetical protein